LHSQIKQRKPLARIVKSGVDYYLDSQGERVPLSDMFSARVPIVSGVNSQEDLQKVYPLIKEIRDDNFLKNEIIGVRKKSHDEYELAVRRDGFTVEFGKLINTSEKFKKLKAFYSSSFLDKNKGRYMSINLKYHKQVVAIKKS